MSARLILVLFVLSVCLGLVSCEKIDEVRLTKQTLEMVPLQFKDAIPMEYGRLVAVTSNSQYPKWAQLWFEDEDRTISVVIVNFVDGNFVTNVLTIPRK
jgi:hypothetical protein